MGTEESCWNKSCSEGLPTPQSRAQLGVSPDRLQSETAGRGSPGLTGDKAGCPALPQQVLMPPVGSPAVLSASGNTSEQLLWDLHPCCPPVAAAGEGVAGSGGGCGQARGLSLGLGLRPGVNLGKNSWVGFQNWRV